MSIDCDVEVYDNKIKIDVNRSNSKFADNNSLKHKKNYKSYEIDCVDCDERIFSFGRAIQFLMTHRKLPCKFRNWFLSDDIDCGKIAHYAAAFVTFPPDFKYWDLRTENSVTVAHVAAQYGHLPPGFNKWSLTCNNNSSTKEDRDEKWSVAHTAAEYGHLPSDFNQWELSTDTGWTVAHEAVKHSYLPHDFNQWDLATYSGWSVAHEAALHSRLPVDFDQWDLANEDGWTVAHTVAKHGYLPSGFDQWDLADENGHTVALISAKYGHLPPNFERQDLLSDISRQMCNEILRESFSSYYKWASRRRSVSFFDEENVISF